MSWIVREFMHETNEGKKKKIKAEENQKNSSLDRILLCVIRDRPVESSIRK